MEEGYVFRIIIDGRIKECVNINQVIGILTSELRHPCFINIRSFHPTANILLNRGISIKR